MSDNIRVILKAEVDLKDVRSDIEKMSNDIKPLEFKTDKSASRDVDDLGRSIKDLTKAQRDLDSMSSSSRGVSPRVEQLKAEDRVTEKLIQKKNQLISTENQITNLRNRASKLDPNSEEYRNITREADELLKTTQKYKGELATTDSTKIKELNSNVRDLNVETNKAVKSQQAMQNELKKQSVNVNKFAGDMEQTGRSLTRLAAPVIALGGASVKMSMDFESSFAEVRKTVDASESEFDALKIGIREMAKEVPMAAGEIAEVVGMAGQLGIGNEHLLTFTRTMMDLGVATNMTGEEAAITLARFANITQMNQNDFDRLGATIVELGNNFAATEKEIADMSMRIAGAGHQIGMSEADILGLATALTSVGIRAQQGGTSISRVMVEMASDIETGGDRLKQFAEISGMTVDQFTKAFNEDAAGALVSFFSGLAEIEESGEGVFSVIDELGLSTIRVRDTLLRTTNAHELLEDAVKTSSRAWEENIALTDEAEQRYRTSESQLLMMKNRMVDVGIEIGNNLMPAVLSVVEGIAALTESFGRLPDSVQTGILKFALLTGGLGILLSTGGRVLRMLNTTGGFLKDLGGILGGTKRLVSDTSNAAAGLTGVLGKLASSKVLLATGVVGAIAVAGYAVKTHMDNVKKEKEELDQFVSDFPDLRKEQEGQLEYMKEHQREFERLNALVGEGGDLSHMTDSQRDRYLEMVDLLSQMTDGLETYYNSEGDLIAANTSKMEDLIAAKKEEMELDAIKARKGISGQFDAFEESVKNRDKEIKSIENLIQAKEHEIEVNEKALEKNKKDGESDDVIRRAEERLANSKIALQELEIQMRDLDLSIPEDIASVMDAISSELFILGSELEHINPDVEHFSNALERMLKDDPSIEGLGNVKTALYDIGHIYEILEEKAEKGIGVTTSEFQEMSKALMDTGMTSEEASVGLLTMIAEVESGEDAIKRMNSALDEFKSTGELSEETIKELRKDFSGLPEDIEGIDLAFIQSIAETDRWAAALLASQLEVSVGYSEMLDEIYQKELENNEKINEANLENIGKKLQIANTSKEDVIAAAELEADELIAINNFLARDLKVITEEEAQERNRIIKENLDKQVQDVIAYYNEIQYETSEGVGKVAEEMQGLMDNTENIMDEWNSLGDVTKEFILKESGLKETEENFDELLAKWLKEEDAKELFVTLLGYEYLMSNMEELDIKWDELDPDELEFIAKLIGEGLDDIDGFQEKWDSLDPETKRFIAEAVGIEDVLNADDETMARWAEDPRVKLFLANYGGLDEIILVHDELNDKWYSPVTDKWYKSYESGALAVRQELAKTKRAWDNMGNPVKTFRINTHVTTSGNVLSRNWTGNENFEGGLSFVGEKGRELLVYPDDTYDMTGDTTELRNLPKGTRIYNNKDTEDIMSGRKIPKFADGNAKAKEIPGFSKGNTSASSTKKAVADPYERINIALEKNNNLLKRGQTIQSTVNDDLEKKLKLLDEEFKLSKDRQDLLHTKNQQRRQEVKRLESQLSGIFRFSGVGDDRMITNLGAIKGQTEKVEERFRRYIELQTQEIPKASQEWWNLQKAIQGITVDKLIAEFEILDMQIRTLDTSMDDLKYRFQLISDDDVDKKTANLAQQMVVLKEQVELAADELYKMGKVGEDALPVVKDRWEELNKIVRDGTLAIRNTKQEIAALREQVRQDWVNEQNNLYREQQARIRSLEEVESKIVQIIRKRGEEEQKALSKAHDNEMKSLSERHKERQNNYREDLENFRKYINGQIDALDERYREEDYLEELEKEREKAAKLQQEIDILSLDDSLTARNKTIELRKQLAEQNERIAKMQQNSEREIQKKSLRDQLKDVEEDIRKREKNSNDEYEKEKARLEKSYENKKDILDRKYSDEQVYAEARKAIIEGQVEVSEGAFMDIYDAFVDFENKFGRGMGILGDIIKDEFISKINDAKRAIWDLNNLLPEYDSGYDPGDDELGWGGSLTGMASMSRETYNKYVKNKKEWDDLNNKSNKTEEDKKRMGVLSSLNSKIREEHGMESDDFHHRDLTHVGYENRGDLDKIQDGQISSMLPHDKDTYIKNKKEWDDLNKKSKKTRADTKRMSDLAAENEKLRKKYKVVYDQYSYDELKSMGFKHGGKIEETGTLIAPFHGTKSSPEWIFNDSQLRALMEDITTSSVKVASPKAPGAGSASLSIERLIHIEGNVDKSVVPDIRKAGKDMAKELQGILKGRGISTPVRST